MAAKRSGGDFAANQRQLNDGLAKGEFRRIYLLCGEQAYLRLQNREKLVKALLGDGDAMNLSRYSGSDVSARDVIDMAETLPFFADRRVVVIENSGLLSPKSASRSVTGSKTAAALTEEADKIADFVPQIQDTAAIVMVEENVDKRGRLYKAIAKSQKDGLGMILECSTPEEADLRAWASGIFRRSGLTISGRTLALFLSYAGEDMLNIAGEAEKLCCYCLGQREITEQAVRDAQVILTLMRRQFGQLVKIRELSGKLPDSEIARQVGLPPFVVTKKYRPALRMYTSEELLDALEECTRADHESKSGRIDAGMAVEMIIVRHSGRV